MSTAGEGVTGEIRTGAGGTLRATIVLAAGPRRCLESVRFDGSLRDEPPGSLARLEKALAGASIDEAPARIEEFFSAHPGALPGADPEEFLTALSLAFMKVRRTLSAAPDPAAWKKERR
ncbi:MAG TPA: hypothetical protein VNO22_18925 [Planctomycetota bacterium]|nr:hypothetical protein [Planctomycetota bacterium]